MISKEVRRPERAIGTIIPDDAATVSDLTEFLSRKGLDPLFKRSKVDAAQAAGQIGKAKATEFITAIKNDAFAGLKFACETGKVEDVPMIMVKIRTYVGANCLTIAQVTDLRKILDSRHL